MLKSRKKAREQGKKIIVLGAMRELGDITPQAHIDLKDDIIAGKYDAIYLIGNEMMPLYDALGDNQPTILAEELTDISDEIITETTAGSVIMIKGSNSVKLWQLVTFFKQLGNYYTHDKPTDSDTDDVNGDVSDNSDDIDDTQTTDNTEMSDEIFKKVV